MFKRIQNLYLIISTALIAAMFFCKMGTVIGETGDDAIIRYYEKIPYLLMNIMLLTIFNFKNPVLQARVSVIGALLMIGFQLWLGVDFLRYKEYMVFSVTMLFPLAEAFLNFIAAHSAMVDGVTVQAAAKRKLPRKKRS